MIIKMIIFEMGNVIHPLSLTRSGLRLQRTCRSRARAQTCASVTGAYRYEMDGTQTIERMLEARLLAWALPDIDRLMVKPRTRLTPELCEAIAENKAEIMRALVQNGVPSPWEGDGLRYYGWSLEHFGIHSRKLR